MTDRENGKKVSIDVEYLALLHDFVRLNLSKMKELLGDSSSDTLYDYSTDYLMEALATRGKAPKDLGELRKLLEGWGLDVSIEEDKSEVRVNLGCPYADRVHPRLSPSEIGCPLGEIVLGTVRETTPLAQRASNELTSTGAMMRIVKVKGARE